MELPKYNETFIPVLETLNTVESISSRELASRVRDNYYSDLPQEVVIGDDCMIAPNVGIYTAGHSVQAQHRNKRGFAIPISIGHHVWIGGNAVILPGVSIGDNSIIAAGSVVTRDVGPNVIVAGNPATFLRKIDPDEVG